MKKHIVTIAGRPGSGKSTTAKEVADQLGFGHFSSGDFFRELAKERGIDVLQANISAEENYEIDKLVDERLRTIGSKEDRMVIDSRIAWHWMQYSFKVFLGLDLVTAAQRIIEKVNSRKLVNEKIPTDPLEYSHELKKRLESENRRYMTLYKINPSDMSNYDLVIDTATNDIEQVIKLVTDGFHDWIKAPD